MQTKSSQLRVIDVPIDQPLLTAAAGEICAQHAQLLPNLSSVTVLLPQLHAATQLQDTLLQKVRDAGHQAILQPYIFDLRRFAAQFDAADGRHLLQPHERLLLLLGELRKYRSLYGQGSPWLLAQSLLQLFDEFTMHNVQLPESVDALSRLLSQSYRLPAGHDNLQREARLVLTLWQAWREQLQEDRCIDADEMYLRQLAVAAAGFNGSALYVIGFSTLLPAERECLLRLADRVPVAVLRHGANADDALLPVTGLVAAEAPTSPLAMFLQTAYQWQQADLPTRQRQLQRDCPQSPLQGRLHILPCHHLEQHAQATALYVRAAIADGARRVGIVCEDRRLARRVRALLERSNIALRDSVGWALSTTRAAAVLENYLECLEQDFPHLAFLDLLKSPAWSGDDDSGLNDIYRFEQDIVLHENIGSGIERYRRALNHRATRLGWATPARQAIEKILAHFENIATRAARHVDRRSPAATVLTDIMLGLQQIDRCGFFQNDAAGCMVAQQLQIMREAAERQPMQIDWIEFRAWLRRALEEDYFLPPASGSQSVQLLNLAQSQLLNFDALVIAAADETHLPGSSRRLPFFNDSVRNALGLPDWRSRNRQREFLFRQLLFSSRSILLSWQRENNGEVVAASPWLAALQHLHSAVYGNDLQPPALQQWLEQQELLAEKPFNTAPASQPPAPAAAPAAIPQRLSVSAHQRLIECPYRFYVYDILRLKPLDTVREALQKSDYGNRVHRCLYAFHAGAEGFEPFAQPLDASHRAEAIEYMQRIAREIFRRDIEDNFQHRGWLQRWLDFVPAYIDWQIAHAVQWSVSGCEQDSERELNAGLSLYGRIDRVERHGNQVNLIDYKTGSVPTSRQISSGEDIQLVSYSLLLDHVDSVQYLGVDDRRAINDRSVVDGEELARLQNAVMQRLGDLMQRIRGGAPLPANGDDATCRHCDAKGICRKLSWTRRPDSVEQQSAYGSPSSSN